MKSHAIKNMKYTGNVFYLNLFYVQSFNDAVNDSELFFTHAFQGVGDQKKGRRQAERFVFFATGVSGSVFCVFGQVGFPNSI